jgi:Tol biopolymer transport system component
MEEYFQSLIIAIYYNELDKLKNMFKTDFKKAKQCMYMIDEKGTLEKVSRDNGFDAFPMFSPNGKQFVFSSNRNNRGTRDTNLFIADWVE